MNIDFRNLLPVALKKTIPAVFLLGSLSLGLAPVARAQILFSIDSFTTDELVVTLSGSLTGVTPPSTASQLFLVDGNGTNTAWITTAVTISAVGGVGDVSFSITGTSDSADGDYVAWIAFAPFTAETNVQPLTYAFGSASAFSPADVDEFALFWGNPITDVTAVLQSVGTAQTGGGSAVPEPSTYAAVLGLIVLGLSLARRRNARSGIVGG